MDNGFSVLMLIFGIAILLYTAVLSSGDYKLLPMKVQPTLRSHDKEGQTKHIAAVTAVVAVPIALGGLAGVFFGNVVCLIVMGTTALLLIIRAVSSRRSRQSRGGEDEKAPEDTDDIT